MEEALRQMEQRRDVVFSSSVTRKSASAYYQQEEDERMVESGLETCSLSLKCLPEHFPFMDGNDQNGQRQQIV
jgi:hypothetical protein